MADSSMQAGGRVVVPRRVAAERGVGWWSDAWAIFRRNAGMWILLGIAFGIIAIVLAFVPFIGGFALALLLPVFMGSWMLAARKVDNGLPLSIGDLFSAFNERLGPLVIVGVLMLLAGVVMTFALSAVGFSAAVLVGAARHDTGVAMAGAGFGLVTLLAGLLLSIAISMAVWLAPALIVLDGMRPVDAMKASFAASLESVVAWLVYGIVLTVATFVASIPFGLGFLLLGPLTMLTIYTAYRDVFR